MSSIITRVFDYMGIGGWSTQEVDVGGGGTQTVLTASVDLTTADILAFPDTPVTIVEAIAGHTIVPLGGVCQYFAGSVPFGGNGDVLACYIASSIALRGQASFGEASDVFSLLVQKEDFSAADAALTFATGEAVGGVGPIVTSSLGSAGNQFLPGDTATVDDGTGGLITVSTVANSFPITGVNQGAKTFTVTGDASAFQNAETLAVYRSTGNDGLYTIVSAVFGGVSTVITVVEAIADATADGSAGDNSIGDVGAIATYTLTDPGTGYSASSHALTAVAPSIGADAIITVLTVDSQSDGTATVTVYYAVVGS